MKNRLQKDGEGTFAVSSAPGIFTPTFGEKSTSVTKKFQEWLDKQVPSRPALVPQSDKEKFQKGVEPYISEITSNDRTMSQIDPALQLQKSSLVLVPSERSARRLMQENGLSFDKLCLKVADIFGDIDTEKLSTFDIPSSGQFRQFREFEDGIGAVLNLSSMDSLIQDLIEQVASQNVQIDVIPNSYIVVRQLADGEVFDFDQKFETEDPLDFNSIELWTNEQKIPLSTALKNIDVKKAQNIMSVGNQEFSIEYARTPSEIMQGLSGRDKLNPGLGMLFVFDGNDIRQFHTKGMKFPLDMICIGLNGQVNHIEHDVEVENLLVQLPPCKYVLEVASGEADSLSIGDQMQLVDNRIDKAASILEEWLSKEERDLPEELEDNNIDIEKATVCPVGYHQHDKIAGCHLIAQHHRFEHRNVGYENEFTWPDPQSEEDEVLTGISIGDVARANQIDPSTLALQLKRMYGNKRMGDQVVPEERYTADGQLKRYKVTKLTASQVAVAHDLARDSRWRAIQRTGATKIIQPARKTTEQQAEDDKPIFESFEKQSPPRSGLVPQSGDWEHPKHWVRPTESETDTKATKTKQIVEEFQEQSKKTAGMKESVKLIYDTLSKFREAGISQEDALRAIDPDYPVSNVLAPPKKLEWSKKIEDLLASDEELIEQEANRWGRQEFPALEDALTDTQQDTLLDYSNKGFVKINGRLREGDSGDRQVKVLDSLIRRFSLTEPLKVYRGLSGVSPESFNIGSIIEDKAFLSTSLLPQVAMRAGLLKGLPTSIVFELSLPVGLNAVYVGNLNSDAREAEILLARNQKIKILGSRSIQWQDPNSENTDEYTIVQAEVL